MSREKEGLSPRVSLVDYAVAPESEFTDNELDDEVETVVVGVPASEAASLIASRIEAMIMPPLLYLL